MDTIRNIGPHTHVVPLSNKYNQKFMPLDANGEVPVSIQWFDASSVNYQMERPTLASREIDNVVQQVKPRVLSPTDFMRGGTIL